MDVGCLYSLKAGKLLRLQRRPLGLASQAQGVGGCAAPCGLVGLAVLDRLIARIVPQGYVAGWDSALVASDGRNF